MDEVMGASVFAAKDTGRVWLTVSTVDVSRGVVWNGALVWLVLWSVLLIAAHVVVSGSGSAEWNDALVSMGSVLLSATKEGTKLIFGTAVTVILFLADMTIEGGGVVSCEVSEGTPGPVVNRDVSKPAGDSTRDP
eukprot:2160292-Rhodomonas_salina.1